ncbi:NlpC/P60 family protein [uncultured Eubacterium sp.]|jgi:cell wall-associated NlpC family hydrolase|uniref:C40 family peptidase n=2 Tax=Eubacterium TaxID=1730 RepID=UPI0032661138
MKIDKEKEVETKIHKKRDGKIHKKRDVKIDGKAMSTRTKNNVRVMRKVAESKIIDNIEGGENIEGALEASEMAVRPIKGIVNEGNRIRKKAQVSKLQKEVVGSRLRKRAVNKGRELAKKSGRKAVKKTSKKMAKDTSRKVAKESSKIATKAGTAVAGSVAGPEGTLIGIAAGETAGMKIDNTFYKAEQRSRMMKFFMDKLKPNEEQNDSLFKLVGSMVRNKMTFMIKRAVSLLAQLITPILIIVIAATGIVFAVIAVLYNSPFALFLPPLESGDTIQSVTTQYVSEFNQEIQTLIDEHKDADKGRKVYVDYEGMNSEPSNYYDIMSVYMVKYGYENTATKMNETNKQNLKAVFDDMCKYTTENVTEKKGKKKTKYLEVRITLKTYTDMTTEYQFDEDRTATLNQLMSAYITNNSSGGSQISGLQGSLTPQEISNITDKISNPTQKAVVSFVLAKVGYPYSQPLRNSGKAFDCSSLAYYAWKSAGVDISFGGGTTAAAEAEGLKDKIVKEKNLQPGDLIFYSYTTNGRYKNISHVGIYVGNGKMVEAVDEAHGVCLGNYHNGGLVMICRPGN